uniref:Uncharacterized protein n=1 Tax=Oryza barthii TaxID=65489 RepID=A0A0D3F5X9_9ORYZ
MSDVHVSLLSPFPLFSPFIIFVNVTANPRLGEAALRRVGTSAAAVDWLVERRRRGRRQGVRRARPIKKQNALRVAGVPGDIKSASSLLYVADEECNLLGLLIIKKLTRNHDTCSKIGNAILQVAQKQRQRQKHEMLTQQQNTHPVDRQKKQEK